ncbi:MAG: hypothetical protein AAF579_02455 [Cyanobacteria bacterium P01_C01_bin.118]
MLKDFFTKAPKYARNEFMRSFAWELLYGDFDEDDEQCQRFQDFLEWRITKAQLNSTSVEKNSDLQYFSWIFASGELCEEWALHKLVDTLKLLGTVDDPGDSLLERFKELAQALPQQTLHCLELLAESDQRNHWFARYKSNDYRDIFQITLASEHQEVQKATQEFISRLIARNLGSYRDLL